MITASAFASLLVLPAFLMLAFIVIGFLDYRPTVAEDAIVVDNRPIESRLHRSAWKAYAGLLVDGIRPDVACKIDAMLRRADTEARRSTVQSRKTSEALYRSALASVASAYRHPVPSFLHSYGY